MKFSWLFSLLFICSITCANADDIIFNDVANDDLGNGSLIYPQRHDFQSGDLDLIKLTVSQDADGIWFKADFKNSIRDPARVTTDSGPEPLSEFARKGFYNFNIDIYIDQDRVKGSGNIFTLPGRHVAIAADTAWERVVILTPRPEQMRALLIDELTQQYPASSADIISDKINTMIYFPDQIKVRGKSVSFFVPQQYLGTGQPDNWAITAFVTGAQTSIASNLSLLSAAIPNINDLELGVMQIANGRPANNFGYRGKDQPSPIVDLLATTQAEQIKQLTQNPVRLTGIFSKPPSTEANAWPAESFAEHFGAIPTPVTPAEMTHKPAVETSTIAQRLETLQKLFDSHLITQDEYHQQRQRILNEL